MRYMLNVFRFIPVHTGNIWLSNWFLFWVTVYPCAYREHSMLSVNGDKSVRFIPVHTGNIIRAGTTRDGKPVYPCAYREHGHQPQCLIYAPGLSLCIQGTLLSWSPNCRRWRFIPVHTGNICYRQLSIRQKTVYPCAYREHDDLRKPQEK